MTNPPRWRRNRGLVVAAVTVLVAVAVVGWAVYVHREPAPNPGIAVSLDVSDEPPGAVPAVFAQGQPTMVSPAGDDRGTRMRVADGLLTFQPTTAGESAAYLSTPNLGAPVAEMGARFTFLPADEAPSRPGESGEGEYAGAIALVVSARTENRVPQVAGWLPIHLVVTPANWNLAVRAEEPTAPLEVIAAGEFATRLLQDGARIYEVTVQIDESTATIVLPDGTTRSVTDSRINAWRSNYATFELYSLRGSTSTRGAFQRVWARGSQ